MANTSVISNYSFFPSPNLETRLTFSYDFFRRSTVKICKKHTKYQTKEQRNGFIIVNITKIHKRPLGIILNYPLKIEFQQRHTHKKKKCSHLKQTIEKQAVEIDVKNLE